MPRYMAFVDEPLDPADFGVEFDPEASLAANTRRLAEAVGLEDGELYRRNRPSTSGLDPEGEGRLILHFHRAWRGFSTNVTVSTTTVATWIEDLNPKQLPAVAEECDTS